MNIQGTNFERNRLPEKFKQTRISFEVSEAFKNEAEKIKQWLFANSTVWEILKYSETEKKFEKLKELVWKIDQLITLWKPISYNTDFRLFKEIYKSLEEKSQKVFNSKYLSETWEIYKDYQKYFLKERILANIRMEKPNLSVLWWHIFEYKKLQEKVDLEFILREAQDNEEKEKISYYLNEY